MTENIKSQPDATGDTIVVDLGKQKRKAIKRLRKGTGKLMDEVNECIEELRETGVIKGAARPVVVIVKEKSRLPRWF